MRNLLLLALAALLTFHAQAQSAGAAGDSFQDQSLGRNESVDVSGLYLGKPGISVPLETITEGSFSLPIGLSYDAGGIKVNQDASNVGLGWSLAAGGSITRLANGLPDEHIGSTNNAPYSGYIRTKPWCATNQNNGLCYLDESVWSAINPYNTFVQNNAVKNYGVSMWDGNLLRDPAPDKFIFEVGREKFVFIFDRDSKVLCDRKVRVEYKLGRRVSYVDPYIVSWVVTLDNGVRYSFCKNELTAAYTERSHGKPTNSSASTLQMNKWHISEISFPDERPSINFEYVVDRNPEQKYYFDDILPEFYNRYGTKVSSSPGDWSEYQGNVATGNWANNSNYTYLVSKICCNKFSLQFTYDFSGNYRYHIKPLMSVELKAGNSISAKSYTFAYDAVGNNDPRFLLNNLTLLWQVVRQDARA